MAKVYNLEGSPSDHSPLLLIPEQQTRGNKRRHFHFENAWLIEPMCFQIIKNCWEEYTNSGVLKKVNNCAEKYDTVKKKLYLVLDQKEIFWCQRSKQLWLQEGEKNTKYFHASRNSKKRNNHIQRLKNEEGGWVDWNCGLHEVIKRYFQQLFTSDQHHIEAIFKHIPHSISEQQITELLKPIFDEKVKEEIFHIHPALGPAGMTPAFFQKNWSVVGKNLVYMTRNFFTIGLIGEEMNATNILLIPKKAPNYLIRSMTDSIV
ncbi:uncharacterized protein LOC141680143 [Apium graveolens]|uniref:uncharacterized protein LOC141680143 n=1 Tax=Apium graveolens TaxID=4045 RepID=UPI003D79D322